MFIKENFSNNYGFKNLHMEKFIYIFFFIGQTTHIKEIMPHRHLNTCVCLSLVPLILINHPRRMHTCKIVHMENCVKMGLSFLKFAVECMRERLPTQWKRV